MLQVLMAAELLWSIEKFQNRVTEGLFCLWGWERPFPLLSVTQNPLDFSLSKWRQSQAIAEYDTVCSVCINSALSWVLAALLSGKLICLASVMAVWAVIRRCFAEVAVSYLLTSLQSFNMRSALSQLALNLWVWSGLEILGLEILGLPGLHRAELMLQMGWELLLCLSAFVPRVFLLARYLPCCVIMEYYLALQSRVSTFRWA